MSAAGVVNVSTAAVLRMVIAGTSRLVIVTPPPSHLMRLFQQLQSLMPPPEPVQHAAEVVPHELRVDVQLAQGDRLAPEHEGLHEMSGERGGGLMCGLLVWLRIMGGGGGRSDVRFGQ